MLARSNNRTLLLLIVVLLVTNGIMLYLLTREEVKPVVPELSRSERMIKMVQDELSLDSAQVQQYISLRTMRDSLIKPIQEEMRANKMAIMGMVKNENVDSAALLSATSKLGVSQAQIESQYFFHFRRMTKILREDQLPKFDSLMTRMVNRSTGQDNQNRSSSNAAANQTAQ
jgi:hypothetical protein